MNISNPYIHTTIAPNTHHSKLSDQSSSITGEQYTSPLGRSNSGFGSFIGGLVGAAIGLLMPIPFLGSMLGALIGSVFGGQLFGGDPAAVANMGQQYGPMNGNMAGFYGYPQDVYQLPQGFPNPLIGPAPLFPEMRMPRDPYGLPPHIPYIKDHGSYGESGRRVEPKIADHTVAQFEIGLLYNDQRQNHYDETTKRSQVATGVIGVSHQEQKNVHGHNAGKQVATQAVGVVRQTLENKYGDNKGNQWGAVLVGGGTQLAESIAGNNSGDQTLRATTGIKQVKTTTYGNNSGEQFGDTVFGDVEQKQVSVRGQNSGKQEGLTTVGSVRQDSHSGGSNTSAQVGQTIFGARVEQNASGGDGSHITQDGAAFDGRVEQKATAGSGSTINQDAVAYRDAKQEATVGSGLIVQEGGTQQVARGTEGPTTIHQTGDAYQDTNQLAVGSAAADTISQETGRDLLGILDEKGAGEARLGAGNDSYTYQGNTESNVVRVDGGGKHRGPDRDVVRINTGGDTDTAIVSLSGDQDVYDIDLGTDTFSSENDRLVINENGQKIRITDPDGNEIYRSQGWTEQDSSATVAGMEQLSVYRKDGTFSKWDPENGLSHGRDAGRPGEMSPVRAARVLREHAGSLDTSNGTDGVDGIIGRADLTAALESPDATPELKEAIRYTLANESMWNALDAQGAGSNRTSLEGLNAFIDGYEQRPSYDANAPLDQQQAVRIMHHHSPLLDHARNGFEKDGSFSEADLRAIVSGDNQSLPPELRAAANMLLRNENSFQFNLDRVSWDGISKVGDGESFSLRDLAGFGR